MLRAGRPDEAIARLDEGIAAEKDSEIASDWAYLALAHARGGRFDEARRWLGRLRAWSAATTGIFWDLQELSLLRDEAESLVGDAGFPRDPFALPGP